MAIGFFELVIVLLIVGFFVAVFSGKGRGLALGLLGAFGFALVLVIAVPFLAYRASEAPAIVAQEQQPPPWVTQGMAVRAQAEAREGEALAEPKVETAPVPAPESPKAEEAPKAEPPNEAEPPKPEEAPKTEPPKTEEPPKEAEPPKPAESPKAEEAPKPEAPKPAEAPKAEEAPKSEPPKEAESSKPEEAPKTEPPKAEEPPKPAEVPKAEEAPKPEAPKPVEPPKAEEAPKSEPPKPAEAPKTEESPKVEPPKVEEPPKPAEEAAKVEPPKPAEEAPKPEPPKPADENKSESSVPAAVPGAGPSNPEPPKPDPPKPEPPQPELPKPEADPGTVEGFVESVNKQGNQPTAQPGSSDYQGVIQPTPSQPQIRIQAGPPNSSGGSASRSYRVQTGPPMPWATAHKASFAVSGLMVIGVLVFVPILILLANRKSRPYALGVLGFLVLLAGPIVLFGFFWVRSSVQYDVAREQQRRELARVQRDMEGLDRGGQVTQPAVAPPSVALSAEAEPGKTPPAPKRPAWVDEPSRRVNGVYRTKITIGPYATRAEIDQLLPRELQRATAAYMDLWLEPGAGRQANVPLPYIHQRIVQEEWEETTQASFGPMLQLHVLLQFDDGVRSELQQMYRDQVVEQRVRYTAGLAGLVVILLGTVFGFLKLDTATKGYYTGRLLLAAAAMILGVVIAGAFACMA